MNEVIIAALVCALVWREVWTQYRLRKLKAQHVEEIDELQKRDAIKLRNVASVPGQSIFGALTKSDADAIQAALDKCRSDD